MPAINFPSNPSFIPLLASEVPAADASVAGKNAHDVMVYLFNREATTTPSLTEYSIPESAWQDTASTQTVSGGIVRDSQASVILSTTATQLDLNSISNIGGGGFGVWVNSVFQYVNSSSGSANVANWIPVLNLGTGTKTIKVQVYGPIRTTPGTNDIQVPGILLKLRANAPVTYATKSAPSVRYVIAPADSIANSGNGDNLFTDGYPMRLRQRVEPNGNRVSVYAISGASLIEYYGTATGVDKAGVINHLDALCDGTSQNVLIIPIGTNDAGRNTSTASQFATNLGNLLDDFKTRRPTVRVVIVTPIINNNYESLLETFRAAERTVASSRSLQVIEGPALMEASYLSNDGTHPTTAGHTVIESRLWAALNALPEDLTTFNAEQLGEYMVFTSNASGPVEYQADGGSWTSQAPVLAPSPGSHTYGIRLKNNISKQLFQTLSINEVVTYSSNKVTRFGTGWSDPTQAHGFTYISGDYLTVTGTFTGFKVYNAKQANTPEEIITVDNGTPVSVNMYAPGTNNPMTRIYTSPTLAAGQHTIKLSQGSSSILSYYSVELIGSSGSVPVTPTQLFANSSFDQPLGTDFTTNWVPTTNDYVTPGTATASNGLVTVTTTQWVNQYHTLIPNKNYRLEVDILAISGGGAVAILGNGGDGQLNAQLDGPTMGTAVGTYGKNFKATTTDTGFWVTKQGGGNADIGGVRLIQLD